MLAWIGCRNSPTLDEVAHLPAGISHWHFGNFSLYNVNPPLVRAVAASPMLLVRPQTDWNQFNPDTHLRSEFSIGHDFIIANGSNSFWYFTLARWACIPLILIGGFFCYLWARCLYGHAAGVASLLLWCFSPNIMGNAAMITPDAAAASMGLMAGFFFWRWLKQPTWQSTVISGLGLGVAALTKSTWIVLFGLWPTLWFIWRLGGPKRIGAEDKPAIHSSTPLASPSFLRLIMTLAIGLYIINLGYGFEESFTSLRQFKFVSHSLGGPNAYASPGSRFTDSSLGRLLIPLPANYLRGLDIQRYDFEIDKWSYLFGEQKPGGWWYWYLVALTVKTPTGTIILAILALIRVARAGQSAKTWHDEFVLLMPAVTIFLLVSSQIAFSRYFRYLLPAFPFCFVWLAGVCALRTDRALALADLWTCGVMLVYCQQPLRISAQSFLF